MGNQDMIQQLYEDALAYRLADFQAHAAACLEQAEQRELTELYLLRAQLKLFSTDETLFADLAQAEKMGGRPRFPCLFVDWQPQDPNAFIVFCHEPGALQGFLQRLPAAADLLARCYGKVGRAMVCQIQSEILYFSGNFTEAAALARAQYKKSQHSCSQAIMAAYVLFRCCLAQNKSEDAAEIMHEIISQVRRGNEEGCSSMYRTVRAWTNLTTGWSGDTPRYHHSPSGYVLPVLEDRAAEILEGISRLGPTEEPFANYAAANYTQHYTVRQLYMDVFHAMNFCRIGAWEAAEQHFRQAYTISRASGLIMPLVEYGKQIMPLLEHIGSSRPQYDAAWLAQIQTLAEQYEAGIDGYRD